jgi:hypothetical protein
MQDQKGRDGPVYGELVIIQDGDGYNIVEIEGLPGRDRQTAALYHYQGWRERAAPFAARLKDRIIALGAKSYPGCGFHYALVRRVVKIKRALAEPLPQPGEIGVQDIATFLVPPLALSMLAAEVATAERAAQDGGARRQDIRGPMTLTGVHWREDGPKPGWYVNVSSRERAGVVTRFLWSSPAKPNQDDLAAAIRDVGPKHGLHTALAIAATDETFVRREYV